MPTRLLIYSVLTDTGLIFFLYERKVELEFHCMLNAQSLDIC